MDTIRIRPLQTHDADDVWRIFRLITKSAVLIDYTQALEDHLASHTSASFVAESGGRVVGFMFGTIIACGFGLLDKSAWIFVSGPAITDREPWLASYRMAPRWGKQPLQEDSGD